MIGVVAYDIADNRRRTRVRTLLEEFGLPVQESVFLVDLNPAKWQELERRMLRVTVAAEDDVRVWPLCQSCGGRARVWRGQALPQVGPVIIQ